MIIVIWPIDRTCNLEFNFWTRWVEWSSCWFLVPLSGATRCDFSL